MPFHQLFYFIGIKSHLPLKSTPFSTYEYMYNGRQFFNDIGMTYTHLHANQNQSNVLHLTPQRFCDHLSWLFSELFVLRLVLRRVWQLKLLSKHDIEISEYHFVSQVRVCIYAVYVCMYVYRNVNSSKLDFHHGSTNCLHKLLKLLLFRLIYFESAAFVVVNMSYCFK